ncbi:helix-turn-helix domain-containing protein [Dawidia soli]|uniref:Helix-turn-helix domain-containing protein n=1 Tax=Dawidia soli TaxID=2782352 RepID=A0AAP2DBD3_9BACT|nr:helix-turn-helix transcriptional regulator [Dawidia soli]MBT1687510.1 helix-turn-helix domain-containing protein [Dawidia soli]
MIKTDMRNSKKPHLGENVRHLREAFGLKQEALAGRLGEGWSQKKISVLESRADIDDDDLRQLAEGLGVGIEHIKNYDHEKVKQYIQNNYSGATAYAGPVDTIENQVNNPGVQPEVISQIKNLYDDLLKSEREKIALLEKLLEAYKKV